MVRAGSEMLEDSHAAAASGLRDAHGAHEVLAAKMRGATERHEFAAGGERAHRHRVELDIEMLGARRIATASGERRRIKHDEIEPLLRVSQEFAGVALEKLDKWHRL